MKILFFILPVVAAFSNLNYEDGKEGPVTSSKVNYLVSEAVDFYFRTSNEWVYHGTVKTIPVHTQDIDIMVEVSNVKQLHGDPCSQSQSTYLSENEFNTSLSLTAANITLLGQVEIKGIVKGQKIEKKGTFILIVKSLSTNFALNANHDDRSVTLLDYEIGCEYSEPMVDLQFDFDYKELVATAFRSDIKKEMEHTLEFFNKTKSMVIANLNHAMRSYNLLDCYLISKSMLKFLEHYIQDITH